MNSRIGSVNLFPVDPSKKKSEKAPDWRGDGEVNGLKVSVVAWNATARTGRQYLNLSFEPYVEREKPQPTLPTPTQGFDDEIPF